MTRDQYAAIYGAESEASELLNEHVFDRFDSICELHGVEPKQLADTNDATLETWMREVLSPKEQRGGVVAEKVRKFLPAYLMACR